MEKFIQASIRGWEYAFAHPEEVADKISLELPRIAPLDDARAFNRFQIDAVKELTLYPVVELGHINPNRWRHMHDLLSQFGIVKKP